MAVGLMPTKADVDTQAGYLAQTTEITMTNIRKFKIWLDAQLDADLTALGYSAGDIATLRSTYTDLDKLAQVYMGSATQTTAYDFRTFAKRMYRFGF